LLKHGLLVSRNLLELLIQGWPRQFSMALEKTMTIVSCALICQVSPHKSIFSGGQLTRKNGELNIVPFGKYDTFSTWGIFNDISPNSKRLLPLLVPSNALGISPVRVDEQRTLNAASSGVDLGQVEFWPRPAVSEVGEPDALKQGGARLLVVE